MINFNNKTIGIWGLGIVGKSVIEYLHSQNHTLTVMDRKPLTTEEHSFLTTKKISYILQDNIQEFLENNNYIIASPGIDLRAYSHYQHKFISELDIFATSWAKPVVAITGTIGKTSITHILSQLLTSSGKQVITGGNIGTGILDLIKHQETADCAVLELSSFQLENSTQLAPDLAIWTNLFPNHLDRHGTVEDYFLAKYALLKYQKNNQQVLVPHELAQQVRRQAATADRPCAFFSLNKPELCFVNPQDLYYYFDTSNNIVRHDNKNSTIICTSNTIPEISYPINWLIIFAALDLLHVPINLSQLQTLELPDHRLDLVGTNKSIEFYNDSKSTIMESTVAAVEKLKKLAPDKPIILLLGGLSKDVDRAPYIKQLKSLVSKIVCFGLEANSLYNFCTQEQIPAVACVTLEQAFAASLANKSPEVCILFSPGGSSYDLFKDYQQRGERFKQLVQNYLQESIQHV